MTAAAFKREIERVLDPRTGSYGQVLLGDIVGAKAYSSRRARKLAGVHARRLTLVIRLTRPVPNLPARLASAYFCAVPPDTPVDPQGAGWSDGWQWPPG